MDDSSIGAVAPVADDRSGAVPAPRGWLPIAPRSPASAGAGTGARI